MISLKKLLEASVIDLDKERLRRTMIDFAESEIEWLDVLQKLAAGMKEKLSGKKTNKLMVASKEPEPVRTKDQLKQHVKDAGNWKDWYHDNHTYLKTIIEDEEHLKKFLKILAATSMAAKVDANATMAIKQFKKMVLDGVLTPEGFTGLSAVKTNLSKVAQGQDIEGPKVGPYSKALAGDPNAVAVDRHIFEIIFGTPSDSDKKRDVAKKMIAEVAEEMGLEPRQVQAALWAANQIRKNVTPQNYIQIIEKKKKQLQEIVEQLKVQHAETVA